MDGVDAVNELRGRHVSFYPRRSSLYPVKPILVSLAKMSHPKLLH